MALINDPDNLTDSAADDGSTNLFIDTANKFIKLVPGVGGLVAIDGVTEKAVYSKLKEDWINDPNTKNLAAFDFPMRPITDEFYELVDGWNYADAATKQSIRSGGWLVRNGSGNVTEHWANITGLGNIFATDQLYYDLGAGPTDFTFTGAVNEAIQVISDPNGDGDYADGFNYSTTFTIYNREYQQLYSSADLTDIGVTDLLAPKAFSFPIGTGDDVKITNDDTVVSTTAPYTGMSITFYSTPQSRTIGGSAYDFGIIIDGNNGTKEEIYEFVQWSLRQATDIDADADSLIGQIAPELLQFVGDTLFTKLASNPDGGGDGVYIDNFQATDTNSIVFVDSTGATQTFPFVASGNITFNPNLSGDTAAKYWVFFSDGVTAGQEFGNTAAILVDDNAGADLTGLVTANTSIAFDFDYDNNVQGGRTAGTDVNVTAIAIGLETGQHVKTSATIVRSNANSINFVAALERNYDNPA